MNNKILCKYFPILMVLCTLVMSQRAWASFKSTTGNIHFDANRDSISEMVINSTGVGIGTIPSSKLSVAGNASITGKLSIGGSGGSSNLSVAGTFGLSSTTISSNTTAGDHSVILADSSSANIDVALPDPATRTGSLYTIKRISDSGNVSVTSNVTINGTYGKVSLASHGSTSLMASHKAWFVTETIDASIVRAPLSANCLVWYDGADSSTVTVDANGNVIQWKDKSGNDYHLADLGSKHPTYSSHWTNGLGAVDFTRDNFQYLKVNALPLRGSMTVFAIAQMSSGGSNDANSGMFGLDGDDGSSNRTYGIRSYNGDTKFTYWPGPGHAQVVSSALNPGMNSPYLCTFYRDKDNELLGAQLNKQTRLQSSFPASAGNITVGAQADLYIGIEKEAASRFHYGYIGEFIIYNKILNDDEMAAVRYYLMSKWGL